MKLHEAKFTIQDFNQQFPNDDVCLEYIFQSKYPEKICTVCWAHSSFYRVSTRKCYSCSFCGSQIHPTAGTIFHKSPTSLRLWFYAIYLFSQSKNGVSAKELERQLGVTYKTAWRIAASIRKLMDHDDTPLSGTIEIDEAHIGGKGSNVHEFKKTREGLKPKEIVLGMVERKGRVATRIVNQAVVENIIPVLEDMIEKGSNVYTDKSTIYEKRLAKKGYVHESVNHSHKEYVRGDVHTNTIESFWSQIKRSLDGTYHVVSPKYLAFYLSEFVFRYNHRHAPQPMFYSLLEQL